MNLSRITLLILSLMLESGAAAQLKSLCTLVTAEDARTFFEKVPDQKMDGLKGQPVMLTAVNYTASPNAKQLFEMNRRRMEEAKGSPKDEQGLGRNRVLGVDHNNCRDLLTEGETPLFSLP